MRVLIFASILSSLFGQVADISPERRLAINALKELEQVCEREGMQLWRRSLCGPRILVNPSTRLAVANRPDPNREFQKEGNAFVGRFPESFVPANTTIRWDDQDWATVMLPLAPDLFRRLKLLTHESFHRIQRSLALTASDAANPCLETKAGRLWLRLELRALSRALRSQGSSARQSASDAMLFRMRRYQFCSASEAMETAMERHEGLAEYTGVVIAMRATGEDVSRTARLVESFEDSDGYARSFAYATGPALGLLLDRYAAGWRGRAATTAMHSMLLSTFAIRRSKQLPRLAERRAMSYGYPAIYAAENEREALHKALLAEVTRKFVDGATLNFPKAPNMSRNFNPGAVVPFLPHGTYYPTGTFSANWGRLQVDSGGALVSVDNQSLRVTAPTDFHSRPVQGAGWVLQLAPGWTIRRSEPAGWFAVVPAEDK